MAFPWIFRSSKKKITPKQTRNPSLSLLINISSGDYVISRYEVHSEFGFDVSCGSLFHVGSIEMRDHGVDIIMKEMMDYMKRKGTGESSELSAMSSKQAAVFNREHYDVGVSLIDNMTRLRLSPTRKISDGGGVGEPGDMLYVDLPCDNITFMDYLDQAYDTCKRINFPR